MAVNKMRDRDGSDVSDSVEKEVSDRGRAVNDNDSLRGDEEKCCQ